jgi:hypothetical protein
MIKEIPRKSVAGFAEWPTTITRIEKLLFDLRHDFCLESTVLLFAKSYKQSISKHYRTMTFEKPHASCFELFYAHTQPLLPALILDYWFLINSC